MSEDFNRQNVIDNLMTLVQNSSMKVGEIEKRLGVSAGYLSRLSKKENESALSAEFLWKISRVFGINVDTLVNEHIGQEDKMIAYMRKFISKLTAKTSEGELVWTPVTVEQINNMLMGNSSVQFPVSYFYNANFPKEPPHEAEDPISIDNALACYGDMKVVSAVYGGIVVNPQGSVYYTTISDGPDAKRLYLACYCSEEIAGPEEFLELMFVDTEMEAEWWHSQDSEYCPRYGKGDIPNYVEEVCNTLASAWAPIRNEMKDLYRTVNRHEDDIQLTASVKSAIDLFMADDELPV